MKSALLKALPLAAVLTLNACETTGPNNPSAVERRYYAQCATNPPTVPCGHY